MTILTSIRCLLILLPALVLRGQQAGLQIDPNLPTGDDTGACVFRIRIDGNIDVILNDDRLVFRTRSGREPVDLGSVCSAPLPEVPLRSFRMDVDRGRGRVLLVENPAGRNGFQAWIRVDDEDSGDDIYELRIGWRLDDLDSAGDRAELRLVSRGTPARWVPEGSIEGAVEMPGTQLNSYDNDPLRYESGRSGELQFRGRVDGVVEFLIRGDQLHSNVQAGQPVQVERFRFSQPFPATVINSLGIDKKDGRGTVTIAQQPTAANSYTVVVRVEDTPGGSDRYHWILRWTR